MTQAAQPQSALLMPLKKIKAAFTYPGAFFRYKSDFARNFYHGLARVAHPRTYLQRCTANDDVSTPQKLTIKDAEGFAVFSPDQVPDNLAQEVTTEIRARLKTLDIDAIRQSAVKPYLLTVIKPEEISRDSAIYKLVTNRDLISSVARYLKCFPVLTYIAVWYSPNLPGQEKGSQRYHLDHEDYRQIKAFMFVEDIGPQNGPFTFIPASESKKIQDALNYKMTPDNKQIDDEVVYNIVDKSHARPLTGAAGTLGLIDTSRCFHYGSREGTAPRIMLAFQYMTPFAFVMPWNWRKKTHLTQLANPAMSEKERQLLGLSI